MFFCFVFKELKPYRLKVVVTLPSARFSLRPEFFFLLLIQYTVHVNSIFPFFFFFFAIWSNVVVQLPLLLLAFVWTRRRAQRKRKTFQKVGNYRQTADDFSSENTLCWKAVDQWCTSETEGMDKRKKRPDVANECQKKVGGTRGRTSCTHPSRLARSALIDEWRCPLGERDSQFRIFSSSSSSFLLLPYSRLQVAPFSVRHTRTHV